MARPKIVIDGKLVTTFAQLGCMNEEVAAYFGCSTDTIERRFAGEMAKGRADLRMNLRKWQLKSAQNGNVVMQIWLGKQMLKQVDQQKIEHSSDEFKVTVEDYTKK
jgi:hypothetical protein